MQNYDGFSYDDIRSANRTFNGGLILGMRSWSSDMDINGNYGLRDSVLP